MLRFLPILVMAIGVVGCLPQPSQPQALACSSNADCRLSQRCTDGVCVDFVSTPAPALVDDAGTPSPEPLPRVDAGGPESFQDAGHRPGPVIDAGTPVSFDAGVPAAASCLNASECSDGNFCNGAEVCVAEHCAPAPGPACQGDAPFCDEDNQRCLQCQTAADCADGQYCTGEESCAQGVCQSSGNPCAQMDQTNCLEASDSCGQCANDADCDDGLFCNGLETCDGNGGCLSGTSACPNSACSEAAGACVQCVTAQDCRDPDARFCEGNVCVSCASDADCTDSLFCTTGNRCEAGQCVDDGPSCPADHPFCNEVNDSCDVCQSDSDCGVDRYCNAGDCVECVLDSQCDDDKFCNGIERCNGGICQAETGPCQGATPVCIEAAKGCVACQVNSDCASATPFCQNQACVACLLDTDCDDGNYCTANDSCVGNVCQNVGNPCPAAQPTCLEDTDSCVSCQTDTDCPTSQPHCWVGLCLECLVASECNNGDFCDGLESCASGSCVSSGDPCASSGGGTPPAPVCDESADQCVMCLLDTDCAGGEFCVNATCVACRNNGDCNDNLFCTAQDTCSNGVCSNSGSPCSAPSTQCVENGDRCVQCLSDNDCPNGFCVGESCVECVANSNCSDNKYCNGVEQCVGNACTSGGAPCNQQCDESTNSCVQCLTATDCTNAAAPFCVGQKCVTCEQNSDCAGTGSPYCSNNQCVQCVSNADCSDGAFCNGTEVCSDIQTCIAGSPPCSQQCDEVSNQCVQCLANSDCSGATPFCVSGSCEECNSNSDCTDATFCNGTETCNSAHQCVSSGDPCAGTASPLCDEFSNGCFECATSADCGGNTPFCVAGACQECNVNADCNDQLFCTGTETCRPNKTCVATGNPCSIPTPACVEANDTCGECNSDTQCGGSQPRCYTGANTCVQCLGNSDCSGGTPFCKTTSHVCKECLSAADCPVGNSCLGGICGTACKGKGNKQVICP